MTHEDAKGLSLSTESAHAAACYREGVSLMLAAWPGAAEALDEAIASDPDFALAHAARARLHATRAELAKARASIATAQEKLAGRGDAREASHVNVLALAITRPPREALPAALDHAALWPRDRIVFSLPLGAFGLLAFSGRPDHDQARVDLCERHAAAFETDDWWFLTYRGWALAENREAARGRALLERAYELRRENANGVHALAHAMFEGGDGDGASALIADWLPGYGPGGILHGHIAWHAALAALEKGDAHEALTIYEAMIQPKASNGVPINVVSDGAALLWRMECYGYAPPRELWRDIADYARAAFPNPGHGFLDPHMALIEASTGQRQALASRIGVLDDMVGAGSLAAGPVAPAIARAALAFADGDFAGCARILEPVAKEVVRIGGSGAQREIVEDTLLVALMRSGSVEKARALLDRRLHRRPSPRDTRWLAQLMA